jgi:hypothetical protein
VKAIMAAFLHFYYADLANATVHIADVKFSPITFGLCDYLATHSPTTMSDDVDEALSHVMTHKGQYHPDSGR